MTQGTDLSFPQIWVGFFFLHTFPPVLSKRQGEIAKSLTYDRCLLNRGNVRNQTEIEKQLIIIRFKIIFIIKKDIMWLAYTINGIIIPPAFMPRGI